ncbi:ABC transporter permease [Parafilimonas terrae]|uniref:Putative ABC transport system permease protein n=1 Tax=Parafilimonas terrae TaxID=1465490 RepID=A0A1I5UZD0_9BACT|nr:ABC transporter permease [Parafilimonas terrae]SFQ00578.1 putative ABC transport system permease protein [Parafilimonas terrae]
MFRNYLKIIFRNFTRNKTFSFINIAGLTIGLTSCLLIALYIQQQLSFDKFQKNGDRIARVIMEYSFEGSDASNKGNYTSVRVPMVMKQNFPEVKDAVIMMNSKKIIRYNNNLVTEDNFMYADSSFFNLFSFDLLEGNKRTALTEPYSVVLTQSSAKKYFGNEDPVGKTLQLSGDSNFYKITGLVADCPANSQIQFDFIASFSTFGMSKEYYGTYWNANYTTYLLLHDKNSIGTLQARLPAFMKKEMEGQHATVNFYLEPFNKIHLYSPYDAFAPNVSITYIYILAGVALLILIIGCFTYINLSTARSVERAKEVSIRKVAGAQKNQIFWQFIGESAVVCCIAVLLGLACAALLLPSFSQLTNQQLQLSSLFSLPILGVAILIIVIVSFAAGSYPALVLSSFQPARVLKGAFKNAASGQWLRKSLIIFQFVISVFLIVSTFIIQQQLYYIQHKKLGYDREHVLVLPVSYGPKNVDLIKTEFKQNTDVKNVSLCYNTPVSILGGYNMSKPEMPENAQVAVTANPVDNEFIPAAGLQLIAGENLTEQDLKDVANEDENTQPVFHFILNESATKQLGWTPQEAVGKKMFLDRSRPGYVRGVVKDFNFQSLRNPIKPVVLFPSPYGNTLMVKITGNRIPQTISFLQEKWKTLVPERPFDYRFLDDDYNKLYQNELRLGKIMNIFASIAIILACIGLFGLSAYSAQQRVKEIGVRKVLGATVSNIVFVLSRDFIKLAFIAALIAFPIAWWAMHNWLQNYEYRISIEWWVFVVTALATLLIALITVSFQAIKAALSNPVKNLRTE